MTDYHNHSIAPSAPKPAPDTLVSLDKQILSKLDTLIENTTPEDNEG